MYIYILHWGVIVVIKNIVESINLNRSLLSILIELFSVLFITLFLSYLIIYLKENVLKGIKLEKKV